MSTQYQDLPYTTFPNAVQAFPVMIDIVADDGANVRGFQEAMMNGNTALAQQYYAQITNADKKFINAELLNELFQTCVAVQRFYQTNIKPYATTKQAEWQAIIDQMAYKSTFNVNVQYKKNNYVVYSGNVYIATQDPPVGTYPNDAQYWRLLTVKGQTGESGDEMAFVGEWSSTQSYTSQDVVSYGSALWGATQASTNQIPAEGSSYWTLIFRYTPRVYPVQSATPVEQSVGDLWFQI